MIPVPGKRAGQIIHYGGLLGSAPIMPVPRKASKDFILRKGFELFGHPMAFRFRARNLIDPDIERTRGNETERSFSLGRSFQIKLETEF